MIVKNKTLKSLLFLPCFFFLASFVTSDNASKFFKDLATVKVEKETNTIFVSVKASRDNKIVFYMFNIEGKLIKELTTNGSKKFTITQLEKGIYLYECFSNDERIVNGSVELK